MSTSKNTFKVGDKVICVKKGTYPNFNLPFDTVFTVAVWGSGVIKLVESPLFHLYSRFILASDADIALSPVCKKIRHMEQRFKEKQHAAI